MPLYFFSSIISKYYICFYIFIKLIFPDNKKPGKP